MLSKPWNLGDLKETGMTKEHGNYEVRRTDSHNPILEYIYEPLVSECIRRQWAITQVCVLLPTYFMFYRIKNFLCYSFTGKMYYTIARTALP